MPMKQRSDVNMHLRLLNLPNNNSQNVVILTSGSDKNTHVYTYYTISDVKEFEEDTNVYDMLQKAFDVPGYQGSVQVIVAPSTDALTSNSTSDAKDGTNVQPNSTNRFIYALSQNLPSGANYLLTDGLSIDDLQKLTDYVYKKQNTMLFAQFDNVKDALTVSKYSATNQPKQGNSMNAFKGYVSTTNHKIAIQTAVEALAYAPMDIHNVSNMPEFEIDPNLTAEDMQALDDAHVGYIVDKADDLMVSDGKTAGDNYVDQLVNVIIIKNKYQYNMQKQLNAMRQGSNHFDDKTIGLLEQTANLVGNDLYGKGFVNEKPVVHKTNRKDINNALIEKRHYNGLTVDIALADTIESMDMYLNVTE